MTRRSTVIILAMIMACGDARAGDDCFCDAMAPYRQRIDGVTVGAGDAKEVNAATQIIDPWPPYAANRRIPGDGKRMVGAVERYRDVRKLGETPPTLTSPIASSTGTGASAGSGGSSAGTGASTGQ